MSGMLSSAVDGFKLAYDRAGEGPAVVLLHRWPGDRTDYRRLAPMLIERGCDERLRFVDGVGHYAPLEYPEVLAEEIVGLG
jgi:pimeloyl-ACP methyl ester carboxylesterase